MSTGAPTVCAQANPGQGERVQQTDDLRNTPPALRQAVAALMAQPIQMRAPMRELMAAQTQSMAADQALLQVLRQRLAQGSVPPSVLTLARNLVQLPLEVADQALADAIRQADAQLLVLGPDPSRTPLGDEVLRRAWMALQLQFEAIQRLSVFRRQLAAPLAAPIDHLAGDAAWSSAVQIQRVAQGRVEAAQAAVWQARFAWQASARTAEAAVAAHAARERAEVMALQRRLRQEQAVSVQGAGAERSTVTALQALLARRVQDLDRIATPDGTPFSAEDLRVGLLRPMPWAAGAADGLGNEWLALQADLGRQAQQWARAARQVAPHWRARSRLLAPLIDARTTGIAPDLRALLEAEAGLLDGLSGAGSEPADAKAPGGLTGLAVTLEDLAGVEVQIAQATRLLAEELAAAGDTTLIEALQVLAREQGARSADLTAFDEAGRAAGPLFEQFEAWLDRLIAARARLWADLARPLPSVPTDGLEALPGLLHAALAERAAGARDDAALRIALRRTWATDPLGRMQTGRHRHRPWNDAAPLAGFIEQALREVVARDIVTQALRIATDPTGPDAGRASALVALVDPLTLAWDLAPGELGLQLRIDLAGGTLLIDGLARAAPRLELQPPARRERLVLLAQAEPDYGSPEARRFWAETDPSGQRPLSYGGSIVYSMRRSTLSYVLIAAGAAAAGIAACPVLAAGLAAGLAMQAVKDVAFGTAHVAMVDPNVGPAEVAQVHRKLDDAEWYVNIATAGYGGVKGVSSLAMALRQQQLAMRMLSTQASMAAASSRLAAAGQTSRFLQQVEAGAEAAARGRGALLAGSDAGEEAVRAFARAEQVRAAVRGVDAGLPTIARGTAAATAEAQVALEQGSKTLETLRTALTTSLAAQGAGGAAAQAANRAAQSEVRTATQVREVGVETVKGHGPDTGGAMGDGLDALQTAVDKFTGRAAQRSREVPPVGSAGASATTPSTAPPAVGPAAGPAVGSRTLQDKMNQEFQQIQQLALLRQRAASAPSVAASAPPPAIDKPIKVDPPVVPGEGSKTEPEKATPPSRPASAPSAPAVVASAPAKTVTPPTPPRVTPAVPDLLAKPTDDYLWYTWTNCGPAGGWWCSLRLTHDRASHLRQRAELNKQVVTIFKSYATREAAVAAICADVGELWVGGQFSCGLLGKIYGGEFCVGEFVLFNSDTKSKACRR